MVVPSLPDNGGRLEALATSEPGWFGLRTVGGWGGVGGRAAFDAGQSCDMHTH